jgi:UDP-N-acetylmuramoyl-tripeptide--D-alanyl-D-alanine ligase
VAYGGISTDSRTTRAGDLYVALVGERFDGHDFVADALAAGASGAVVSRPVPGAEGATLYPVEDTLVALGRLARHRRDALRGRVIGITGSSGKTGTKDLMAAAIGASKRVHATPRNLNNRIGVPLTLLDAPDDAEALVVEMGTNEPGEIRILTEIVHPEIGVVTTVSESHLEKLGSLEGVMEEKLDLLRGLDPEAGVAIVGDEPPALARAARALLPRVRVAGLSERADPDLRPTELESDVQGRYRFRWKGHRVSLSAPGRHSVANALLALAAADELGVPGEDASGALAAVPPGPLRGEVRRIGRTTLLVDCYNANPQSVRSALDWLEGFTGDGRRVAVLGTMLELGSRTDDLHRELLDEAVRRRLDLVVAVGVFAAAAREREGVGPAGGDLVSPEVIAEDDPRTAYGRLRERLEGGEIVLLKASRGVALEALVPLFERDEIRGTEAAATGAEGV